MEQINVIGKNKEIITIEKDTKCFDLIERQNDKEIIGIKVNGELAHQNTKLKDQDHIEFVEKSTITGTKIYQAGLKFLIEVSIYEAFGSDYKVKMNHSVYNGFHLSIKGPRTFTENDVQTLKEKAMELVNSNEPITKLNIERDEVINYYLQKNDPIKAQNVHNVTNNIVSLYKLKNTINYFYTEMPINTKYLSEFDILSLSDNEVIVTCENNLKDIDISRYHHYEKIIENYKDTRHWLAGQNLSFVSDINKLISDFKITDLIKSSESYFDINIQRVVDDIIDKNAKYVLIAGPSSSGKTTTTKKLALYLKALGYNPFVISVDDYFKDRGETPVNERGELDFECLEAIDTNLLSHHLKSLINGEKVTMPVFNFVEGKKEFTRVVELPENSIIVMEGLHCLNDELTYNIDNLLKYKIYLSPFMALKLDGHNYISSVDVRILRRIIRDKRTRNRSVDETIAYLNVLREGERKYIYPFINQANSIINTSLPYEIGLLKVYVEPLLYSIENTSPYYEEARRLINFLKYFFSISAEHVSDDSILREFIGGSAFE